MKNNKLRNILLVTGTVITAILAVVVIIISSTLQQRGNEPVAPNVPSSKPKAAVPESCSVSFTVPDIESPVPQCSQKLAFLDVPTNTAGTYDLSPANALAANSVVTPGQTFVYSLKGVTLAQNAGGAIGWMDVLDPRLEYVDGPANCQADPTAEGKIQVACTFQDIADCMAPTLLPRTEPCPDFTAGKSYDVAFRVKVKPTATVGALSNTAIVEPTFHASDADADTATGASCSIALTIAQQGVITCVAKEAHTAFFSANGNESATKIAADSAVTKGQEFNYRLYFNIPDNATDVLVTDTLPAQLSFVQSASNTPAGITYDATTNKVAIPFATLQKTDNAKKLVAEFRVKVKDSAAAGTFTNSAQVTTGGKNPSNCAVALKIESGTTTRTGFYVIKYNDANGDGLKQDSEAGLTWDFEWSLNGDNNWRTYQTNVDNSGRGGDVTDLKAGDKVVIREKGKDGWSSTTPNQMELTLKANEIVKVEFGNRQKTTLGCNNSCSTNSDCASGLSCSNGTCRNAACSAKTNCICDITSTATPTTTTSTPAATTLPQAGSTAETFGTVAVGIVITILGVIGLFAL